MRLGGAAGRLNVTRRGLGTGRQAEIERMAGLVELRPRRADGPAGEEAPAVASVDELAARVWGA